MKVKYYCEECGKQFESETEALKCEAEHKAARAKREAQQCRKQEALEAAKVAMKKANDELRDAGCTERLTFTSPTLEAATNQLDKDTKKLMDEIFDPLRLLLG